MSASRHTYAVVFKRGIEDQKLIIGGESMHDCRTIIFDPTPADPNRLAVYGSKKAADDYCQQMARYHGDSYEVIQLR